MRPLRLSEKKGGDIVSTFLVTRFLFPQMLAPPSRPAPCQVSYKPLVLTVMLAASSSFITPIGYQTNTLVWGPGGYKFTDFMKIGTPLSLVYLVLGSLLIPQIFPF